MEDYRDVNRHPLLQVEDGDMSSLSYKLFHEKRARLSILRQLVGKVTHYGFSCVDRIRNSLSCAFFGTRQKQALVVATVLAALLLITGNYPRSSLGATVLHTVPVTHTAQVWTKPQGFKIVAMVFSVNGGYIDKVHFMIHTENAKDRLWLDGLIATSEQYEHFHFPGNGSDPHEWVAIWAHAMDDDTMYIKIDDDIVYIHEDAIPRIVHSLMAHPEAHSINANVVNHAKASWLHWHTNAIRPYLPDPHNSTEAHSPEWRPSTLPRYPKTAARRYNFNDKHLADGRRWLPLDDTFANLTKTPMGAASYHNFNRALYSWAMATQQHYSLFTNLELNQMDRYWAGNQDGIWNMWYERYSINFLATWGATIAKSPVENDDEPELSESIPEQLGMPLMIDTHAIVAHYSYRDQHMGLAKSDVLGKYRAYANEMVCAKDNQKSAMD